MHGSYYDSYAYYELVLILLSMHTNMQLRARMDTTAGISTMHTTPRVLE